MSRSSDADVPQRAVAALRDALGERLLAVVLFGSRARGDAREDSDWDLLVIAENLPDSPLDRLRFIRKLLPVGLRGAVGSLVRTRREFEHHLTSLYLDIALDGRILYDPTIYATERLTRLRQLIEEAGLYREQTPAGDIWRWKHPPRGPWVMTWEKIGSAT